MFSVFAVAGWAFATVNHRDEKLFAALARAAERRLSEFNLHGIANTAYQWVGDFNAQFVKTALRAFSEREKLVVSWSMFCIVLPLEAFGQLLLCGSLRCFAREERTKITPLH